MITFFLALTALIVAALSIIIWTFKNHISPMPSSMAVRKALFKHLDDLSGKKIVDLGSGWGHLVVSIARKYPTARIKGYENSPIPFIFSFLLKGKLAVSVAMKNFFKANLEEADVVVCYLCPYSMERLESKLAVELPDGASVVSLVFALPGWKPDKVIYADDLYRSPIYFYKKGS